MTLRKQYANSWLVLTARRVGNVLICSGNCCWLSDSAPDSLSVHMITSGSSSLEWEAVSKADLRRRLEQQVAGSPLPATALRLRDGRPLPTIAAIYDEREVYVSL